MIVGYFRQGVGYVFHQAGGHAVRHERTESL